MRNGRNVQLAEAAVLQSRSYTAEEALQSRLIDLSTITEAGTTRRLRTAGRRLAEI